VFDHEKYLPAGQKPTLHGTLWRPVYFLGSNALAYFDIASRKKKIRFKGLSIVGFRGKIFLLQIRSSAAIDSWFFLYL
jgi:hypothetical protein